jgi:hypothetical protein
VLVQVIVMALVSSATVSTRVCPPDRVRNGHVGAGVIESWILLVLCPLMRGDGRLRVPPWLRARCGGCILGRGFLS